MTHNGRTDTLKHASRIVVKVGSNLLSDDNHLNLKMVRSISRQICELNRQGIEVLLVSSGAMAVGTFKMDLPHRPDEIPRRQAVAAIGQAGLILEYEKAFARDSRRVAQILLTGEDLTSRKRYLNARNALNTLLEWRVVPIINENDTVSVEEIKFGDNDTLAALITLMMGADALINLTDIDGLYTRDPRRHADAEFIPVVETIGRHIEKMAGELPGALGTGGMSSKIRAARKVTSAGIPMVIAAGDASNILLKLVAGKQLGTYFVPREKKMPNRKCWIALTLKPRGAIVIDDGAVEAVVMRGKSLLPSGVISVDGDFSPGDAVQFRDTGNQVLGAGLANYGAAELRLIMRARTGQIKEILGHKPYDEVLHRDNLVILNEC